MQENVITCFEMSRGRQINDFVWRTSHDKNVNFTDLHKHCSETLKLGVKRIVLSSGNSSLFTGAANRISSLFSCNLFQLVFENYLFEMSKV